MRKRELFDYLSSVPEECHLEVTYCILIVWRQALKRGHEVGGSICFYFFVCFFTKKLWSFFMLNYTHVHAWYRLQKKFFFVKMIDLSHNRNAESVGKIKGQHKKNLWGNLIGKIRLNIIQNFSFQCFNSMTASVTKCVCVCVCTLATYAGWFEQIDNVLDLFRDDFVPQLANAHHWMEK